MFGVSRWLKRGSTEKEQKQETENKEKQENISTNDDFIFQAIPVSNDVLYEILNYLTLEDIVAVGGTCRELYKRTKEDKLWKVLCYQEWPGVKLRKMEIRFIPAKTWRTLLLHWDWQEQGGMWIERKIKRTKRRVKEY